VKQTIRQPVKGFVSHRCKDYDEAPWRADFEEFLIQNSIEPSYGCTIDTNFRALMTENIENAMKLSNLYIAVITDTWRKVENEGWPKKEWDMWFTLHKGNYEVSRNCIGFILDIKRTEVGFISNLISFPFGKPGITGFKDKNKNLYNVPITKVKELFGNDKNKYFVRIGDYDKIIKRLKRMVEIARKNR